jgi:DNA-directed RNA polymerase subunit M/transcription elongation factor TFIIS
MVDATYVFCRGCKTIVVPETNIDTHIMKCACGNKSKKDGGKGFSELNEDMQEAARRSMTAVAVQ